VKSTTPVRGFTGCSTTRDTGRSGVPRSEGLATRKIPHSIRTLPHWPHILANHRAKHFDLTRRTTICRNFSLCSSRCPRPSRTEVSAVVGRWSTTASPGGWGLAFTSRGGAAGATARPAPRNSSALPARPRRATSAGGSTQGIGAAAFSTATCDKVDGASAKPGSDFLEIGGFLLQGRRLSSGRRTFSRWSLTG